MIIDIKIEPLTSDDAGGFSVVDLKTFLLLLSLRDRIISELQCVHILFNG